MSEARNRKQPEGTVEIPLTKGLARDVRKYLLIDYRVKVDEVTDLYEETRELGLCDTCSFVTTTLTVHYLKDGEADSVRITEGFADMIESLTEDYEPNECEYRLSAGSRYIDPEPPEYCGQLTHPHDDLCPEHGGLDMSEEDWACLFQKD